VVLREVREEGKGDRIMTAHDHREYVEGCFRCDLSRSEEIAATVLRREQGLHAAAAGVDWVQVSPRPHPCHVTSVNLRGRAKQNCPSEAFWFFTPHPQSSASEGWYCWRHLRQHGFYADGREQGRLEEWLIENGWREEPEK
jgi:hypothetical protein